MQSKPFLHYLYKVQSWLTVFEPISPEVMAVLLKEPKGWSDLNKASEHCVSLQLKHGIKATKLRQSVYLCTITNIPTAIP